jgi:pimeloyl-ACP methyl ester carboxylesterase
VRASFSRGGLHVDEAGPSDAPVVVLVHGSLDRGTAFVKVSRRLDREMRVVRYDRRGYGRSRSLPGPYGAAAHVVDLLAVLDERPAIVVGHSYGGDLALAAAVARPDLVRAAAVYEPPMPWTPWWPTTTAGNTAVRAGAEGPEAAAEGFMRRMIGDDRWEALPNRTRADRRAEGVALLGEMADVTTRAPFDPADVKVPVVVGRGTRGAAHHAESTRRLAALLPDAECFEIDGAAHAAHMTHPEQFAELVRRTAARAQP